MAQVQELSTRTQVDDLVYESYAHPVAVLKHSIACPISARGQREFVALEEDGDPPLYAVVVQYARDVSNYIAEKVGVRHETPQVLILSGGEVVYSASHFDISSGALREAAQKAEDESDADISDA